MKKVTKIYVDGGIVGRNPSSFGGTWAFVATDENDEEVFSKSGFHKTEDRDTTNNHTELIAAIHAMEAMSEGWEGSLVSDSQITLGRIFLGWKMKNIPEEYVLRLQLAKNRLGKLKGVHVSGHPTKLELEEGKTKNGTLVSRWNKKCDDLCKMESDKVKGKIKFLK